MGDLSSPTRRHKADEVINAACKGDFELIQQLLSEEASYDIRDVLGRTRLHSIVHRFHF